MIIYKNITKIYPSRTVALNNVSFSVNKGEFVSIVGKSGAGKTTLLKLLLAEEKPTKGKVFFDNYNIHRIRSSLLCHFRCNIGTVFQDLKLLPTKTVYENVAYIMEIMGANKKEISRDVPQVLNIVGLLDKSRSFPRELSGGEQQRTVFARALIHRPKVIIADEPAGNLGPYHTHDIIELLLKVHKIGTTVILSTHDKGIINSLGKRVITLEEGKIIRDEKKGRFIL